MGRKGISYTKDPFFPKQRKEDFMTEERSDFKFNYFFGLVNIVAVFLIVWLLWYIFMNPNTVMKLYTPMYGFSLIVVFLSGIILMAKVLEWPALYNRLYPEGIHPIAKGILLTIIAFLLMVGLNYIVFWGFIGKFGVAYFSPDSIVASGGIGAEPFVARENAATAIVYFFTAFLWMALFWDLGFGRWPWQNNTYGVQVWSRLFAILFFVVLFYILLFHSHVCYLFYPAQDKAAVTPWWEELAGTGSAFFSLGLILCTLVWIVFSDLLWEGKPWDRCEVAGESTFGKGFVVFSSTLTLGIVLISILLQIFNYVWMEPFVGGQYTDGPDWRFIHAGEIAGFFILAAFIWKNYFNNFPNLNRFWLTALIRSIIAVVLGMLIYWFYYSPLATFFLAKVEGFAQPGDTPLVWALLFLSVILIQSEFFDGWPLKRNR
jgi:AAT family amino acid transporter